VALADHQFPPALVGGVAVVKGAENLKSEGIGLATAGRIAMKHSPGNLDSNF
jgi:hypothetical protein